jgi:ABC-type branched-subunit amino acid transport system ATPase component/ABC-type branched-subunit amino acid transport system permease subunit
MKEGVKLFVASVAAFVGLLIIEWITSGTQLTVNLLTKGAIQGLVWGMLALGIVLIYRTSGVINFAVGNMGIVGTAMFALMVINWGFPFWIGLICALAVGLLVGLIVELTVIRRLFAAPRVIVLVATIFLAQLFQGILFSLPEVETGSKYPAVSIGKKFTPLDQDSLGLYESTNINRFTISVAEIQILVIVPLLTIGLAWLLNRTMIGKAIAAASSNKDAARLAGINPKLVSTFVWVLAGFLSTLSAILLSSRSEAVQGLENLGPNTLVRALAAATLARMTSFPRAIFAGVMLGVVQSLIQFNFTETGLIDFLLLVLVIGAIAWQTRGQRGGATEVLSFSPRVMPVSERLREIWWVRNLPRIIMALALVVAIIAPLYVTRPSRHFLYASILCFAICALSVTVLTGWAGQLSLSQMAFAGLSALFGAALVRGISLDIGVSYISDQRFIVESTPKVPFVAAIFLGSGMGALFAAIIGAGALRVRGLMLAVSTVTFGLAAQSYIYRRPFFSGGQSSSTPFRRGWLGIPETKIFTVPGYDIHGFTLGPAQLLGLALASLAAGVLVRQRRLRARTDEPETAKPVRSDNDFVSLTERAQPVLRELPLVLSGALAALLCVLAIAGRFQTFGPWTVGPYDVGSVDLGDRQRNYYYFCLGLLVLVLIIVSRLRRSGIGRRLIGVRDNADGAASYTISPARTKLTAFVLGGIIAGIGGAALAGLTENVPFTERFFLNGDSLRLVGIAVIGGLGSVAGPVLGALWVVGLPAFFPDNEAVGFFTSGIFGLVILLYLPGGLLQVGFTARDALLRSVEKRLPPEPHKTITAPPASVRSKDRKAADPNGPLPLVAEDVTVRFGKFIAVDNASVEARQGEVVGLIGTNGAGKSTMLNAIGGYVNSTGRIDLFGTDVSRKAPEARAALGLGRTFQAATLFPELTVRETVKLALEGRARTGIISTTLGLPHAISKERTKSTEASELINFLGLGRYADRYIAELSTGTRRIVELAGLIALDAKVLCLDEPTAGVAQKETEAFGPLILAIRKELDATMIIIEHDMPLISAISDRLYCLEAGAVIAQGDPDEVRNNPLVIASYLGTDTRALERSDTVAP